ncbi:DUF4240 domain-containing protein [Actinosynnema sp. CA-299493]
MDFRDGLVLQGRDVFTRAVDDPDTLADLPLSRPDEPAGPGWHWSDDDAFREHLPRLSSMFLP